MELSFEKFELDVRGAEGCDDYVQVHDGRSMESDTIGSYCGHTIPAPVMSSSRYMRVRFQADTEFNKPHRGFKATFKAVGKSSRKLDMFKIINRAALGRARFLLCTEFLTARPWAERGSCFTRDLLTARPWAERGSCFTRDLLLTARPWAERGSCFTRDLLTARPWAERGSCFTRDLLTARPWAERGSCFTRDLLLTARPWAERGSCFTRDLLLLFFFMSVTRRKPPLGQIVIGTESRNL